MTHYCRAFVLALLAAASALAQFTVDMYVSPSSNGRYVYGTGVFQYNPGLNCPMCSVANHTYQGTVTITSPSGRTGQCNFYNGSSAANAVNLQCQASLQINGDFGDYTIEFLPVATCSIIGTFVRSPIWVYIHHGITYTSTVGWPKLGPTCPQQPACSGGTTASCPMSVVNTAPNSVCYAYYRSDWLVANGTCWGILGPNNEIAVAADGPGACQ